MITVMLMVFLSKVWLGEAASDMITKGLTMIIAVDSQNNFSDVFQIFYCFDVLRVKMGTWAIWKKDYFKPKTFEDKGLSKNAKLKKTGNFFELSSW